MACERTMKERLKTTKWLSNERWKNEKRRKNVSISTFLHLVELCHCCHLGTPREEFTQNLAFNCLGAYTHVKGVFKNLKRENFYSIVENEKKHFFSYRYKVDPIGISWNISFQSLFSKEPSWNAENEIIYLIFRSWELKAFHIDQFLNIFSKHFNFLQQF